MYMYMCVEIRVTYGPFNSKFPLSLTRYPWIQTLKLQSKFCAI